MNCQHGLFGDDDFGAKEENPDENGAFTAKEMKLTTVVWIIRYLRPWPALMWFALKVVHVTTSASPAEHFWSIEGWIHSKRRNRLSQGLVEKLVRLHTNLRLQEDFRMAQVHTLPWDIELEIPEPMEEEEVEDAEMQEEDDNDSSSSSDSD